MCAVVLFRNRALRDEEPSSHWGIKPLSKNIKHWAKPFCFVSLFKKLREWGFAVITAPFSSHLWAIAVSGHSALRQSVHSQTKGPRGLELVKGRQRGLDEVASTSNGRCKFFQTKSSPRLYSRHRKTSENKNYHAHRTFLWAYWTRPERTIFQYQCARKKYRRSAFLWTVWTVEKGWLPASRKHWIAHIFSCGPAEGLMVAMLSDKYVSLFKCLHPFGL